MELPIRFNMAVAKARLRAYNHGPTKLEDPDLILFDPALSVSQNMGALAQSALYHNNTLAVLYTYNELFLDIMGRWVCNPSLYDAEHVFLAMSRVAPLFKQGTSLIEYFVEKSKILTESSISTTKSPVLLLLAFYRLVAYMPQRFVGLIEPAFLHRLRNESTDPVVRHIATLLLAKCHCIADAFATSLTEPTLLGIYDGHEIDWADLEIVEAKRLANYSSLPASIETTTEDFVSISSSDLAPVIVPVCGELVTRLLSPSTTHAPDFVETQGAKKVMRELAFLVQKSSPVLLYGRAGSGKTYLLNILAKVLLRQNDLVKIHLGPQTDAKLLIGMYTSGDKPGSFQWRSGVLTTAVREGKWVLVEDIDQAPTEVLSILLTLLERRELSIPSRGETVRAHPGFQLISTVRTAESVPDMIGLRLWTQIKVETPTDIELRRILTLKYPLLRTLLPKFITVFQRMLHIYSLTSFISLNKGSHPRIISIRDLMKLCSRVSLLLSQLGHSEASSQLFESHVYENIFSETVDCFCSAIIEYGALEVLVNAIGDILEVPTSRTRLFLDTYVPTLHIEETKIEVGRASLKRASAALRNRKSQGNDTSFARTNHSKKLMEQIGVAVALVEPVLLVGETGTGKTTVVQELAKMLNKSLTVINVSQQTETGDLLGGYKPVNTKSVVIPIQEMFDNLFLATFSLKKNAKFSALLTRCFNKNQWKNVIKLWKEAVKMARELLSKPTEDSDEEGVPKKKRKLTTDDKSVLLEKWNVFLEEVEKFESQVPSLESSFVFSFVEGSLIKAVRNGDWLLLDEINLASADTLESLGDLLNEQLEQRSVLLSERGDINPIYAHPDFRIFGCMNPSTDVGKRDLPMSIRSRFSEIYVHSPDRNRDDLLAIIDKYIARFAVGDDWVINDVAEFYDEARSLAESNSIVDGSNQRPHFSIRTLTRALLYVKDIVAIYGLRRALYEALSMAFLTLLDIKSEKCLREVISKNTIDKLKNAKHILSRVPPQPNEDGDFVQFRHYWLKRGPGEVLTPNYIITPFVEKNLLNLVRATASRKFPVLIQGPTSAGKTSMINYLASITGHKFVRINNHEHTDLQEYLGTYVSDSSGKMVFREGALVEALRNGYWIVLDELNLAPTDVLEALNRLLDDNRELFIPDTQEVVHPHPDFMIFATQNPPGLYGGRKVLSRAFRNRFLELHFDDIPQDELEVILKERCEIAPSYALKIVEVYKELSMRRQSTRIFEQQNSFATLRDLFRWAMREAVGYEQLAANGYMLLAERVRNTEEKEVVKRAIEKVMRVKLDMDAYYNSLEDNSLLDMESPIVWTKAMRRLAVLVETSIKYQEPILLVGETGCGKTSVCQLLAELHKKQLLVVNAHQNTETGDILGAQRPVRNRFEARGELTRRLLSILDQEGIPTADVSLDTLIEHFRRIKNQLAEKMGGADLSAIEEQIRSVSVLFEWADGPLVQALKSGNYFLLDEISLADDSVLERLNSVLEPEKSLFLAEKGSSDALVVGATGFQFFATMNPGGDYGKKELSPALRNRFTEIWVPSMEDFDDVRQIVASRLNPRYSAFLEPLVSFSKWFGEALGNGKAQSGVISLRDILAWVEFLNSCPIDTPNEAALLHGALMVFIDALGTNNTAFLAENEGLLAEKKLAFVAKLSELSQADLLPYLLSHNVPIALTADALSAGYFAISRASAAAEELSFSLEAPTTSANAMRVIRAMQLSKPILLEGSPGVGKTSLVSAISKATGNKLIRINLSEQTDLVDLFGSDAPAEDGDSGEFVWRDAPFLRAMKKGEWVLLDEMNLASQSVLEGLNACLDHRGEAFIPELDKLFPKHPDFKVFAAQNPQYQGGGRKGLPKSFVNRFSVVYVDTLKKDDLLMISSRLFPAIEFSQCEKMIEFMSKLENEVVIKKRWGALGGPWEFNLRDTLRWLSLLSSSKNLENSGCINVEDFLDMLVIQRFRNESDKAQARALFISVFGEIRPKSPYYNIGPDYVQAGGALLPRNAIVTHNSATGLLLNSLRCNFQHLESMLRCVQENIPIILTGPTNSGKTLVIRFLAKVAGKKLSEFAMNSDVDSMDILGGFEQVDNTRLISDLILRVSQCLNKLIVLNLKNLGGEVILNEAIQFFAFLNLNFISPDIYPQFMGRFKSFASLYCNDEISSLLEESSDLQANLKIESGAKFKWFDGLLVQAVIRGDWLVLDNANLCNASVLDRLNSLLEVDGSLIINECSSLDGQPRVLQPHPNFRLFLTVDPKYGELSRAMRNRCVEIFLEGLDTRASRIDRIILGEEYAESPCRKESEELEKDLRDILLSELGTARQLSTFIDALSHKANLIAGILDTIGILKSPAIDSVVAGLVPAAHLKDFSGRLHHLLSYPEFTHHDKSIMDALGEFLAVNDNQGLKVDDIITGLYDDHLNNVGTAHFKESQTLNPFFNPYIVSFLGLDSDIEDKFSLLMLIGTVAARDWNLIKEITTKAQFGKIGDLTFIEKSAASELGRELKRPPKMAIFQYVCSVRTFIVAVIQNTLASGHFDSSIFDELCQLSDIWNTLITTSREQDSTKIRVFVSEVSLWIERNAKFAAVAALMSTIKPLHLHFALTSGFSMGLLWEFFRPVYPSSADAWDDLEKVDDLMAKLDTVAAKLFPDTLEEIFVLRKSFVEVRKQVVNGELQISEILPALHQSVDNLALLSSSFHTARKHTFGKQFTMLSHLVESASVLDAIPADTVVRIANVSTRPTKTMVPLDGPLLQPYPRILDSILGTVDDSPKYVSAVFTDDFLYSAAMESVALENIAGQYLDQSLEDIKILGLNMVQCSISVLADQKKIFAKILSTWIESTFAAHGFQNTRTCLENEDGLNEFILAAKSMLSEEVVVIFEKFMFPAMLLCIRAQTITELGKAWIMFAGGSIQIYVPSSPLDPAIEEHVKWDILEAQKNSAGALVEAWKDGCSIIHGNADNSLVEKLSKRVPKDIVQPRVYRPVNNIEDLFEEWSAFMASAVDIDHVNSLLDDAVSFSETTGQRANVFLHNSHSFLSRIDSRFTVYADLNDILRGYIRALQFGLQLCKVGQGTSISKTWPMNAITFNNAGSLKQLFGDMMPVIKKLDNDSVLCDRILVFFVKLASTKELEVPSVVNQAFQSLYYRWFYRRLRAEEALVKEALLYKVEDTDDPEKDFQDLFPDYEDVMTVATGRSKNADFQGIHRSLVETFIDAYLFKKSPNLKLLTLEGAQLTHSMQNLEGLGHAVPTNALLAAVTVVIEGAAGQFFEHPEGTLNFYKDSCPSEFRMAMKKMEALNRHVSELLAQWPEHDTLQTLERASTEFLQFASNSPVAFLLHKVEAIVSFLNEWEKYAANHVSLKKHLDNFISIVVAWRKLELRSWKAMIEDEEKACTKDLGKWWFHLFETLVIPFIEKREDNLPVHILSALNVFVSNSSYGEFAHRLNLVRAFRAFLNDFTSAGLLNGLSNFITFYEQFTPKVEDILATSRKSSEKNINEVILLASWKDVNLDALKQSARKSHNGLYKVVRKHRLLLATRVTHLIEEGLALAEFKVGAIELRSPIFGTLSWDERTEKLLLCQTVPSWSERPARLRTIDTTERNLKVYIERIVNASAPSFGEYTHSVVEEMTRLRGETPAVYKEEHKKLIAALKTQKHKLLSDTLKELRRMGVSLTAKPEVTKALITVNSVFVTSDSFEGTLLQGCDGHFFRILDILPRLRGAVSGGNEDVPQPYLERGLAAAENLLFSLISIRKPMKTLVNSYSKLLNLTDSLQVVSRNLVILSRASRVVSVLSNVTELRPFAVALDKVLEYAFEVCSSAASLGVSTNGNIFSEFRTKLSGLCTEVPENCSISTTECESLVSQFSRVVSEFSAKLHEWSSSAPHFAFVASSVLQWLENWTYKPFVETSTSLSELGSLSDLEKSLRRVATSILLAVQKTLAIYEESIDDDLDGWLVASQTRLSETLKTIRHAAIVRNIELAIAEIHKVEYSLQSSNVATALIALTVPFVQQYHKLVQDLLLRVRSNYTDMSKSTFIMTQALQALATKGFCAPELPNEQKLDQNMQDGTGLGDGEGAENNSNDVEDDEDLDEHAQTENKEKEEKGDEDDDNDDAVDIEGDMAGDLEDVSDQEQENEDKNDESEDLDDEIDDIDDLDPNALDEKMWDEEAKDDKGKESDKMPQQTNPDENDMQAMEEDSKENENDKEDQDGDQDKQSGDEDDVGEQEDDVKQEDGEQMDEQVPEADALNLPEDMNLDNEDDDAEGSDEEAIEDKMEDPSDERPLNDDENGDDDAEDEMGDKDDGQDEDEEAGESADAETADVEEDSEVPDNEVNAEAELNEDPAEDSDHEIPEHDIADEKENDKAEQGQDSTEGLDGADPTEDDVDMDAAAEAQVGEKGSGAEQDVADEEDNFGASGGASSDLKKEEEETNDESPEADLARQEIKESLKQLGDSLKEFHRRHQEIKDAAPEEEDTAEQKANTNPDEFQHIEGENTEHDTQAMGAAENKDQIESIDDDMAIEEDFEEDRSEPPVKLEPETVDEENDMEVDANADADANQDSENLDAADDNDTRGLGLMRGGKDEVIEMEESDFKKENDVEEVSTEDEIDIHENFELTPDEQPAMPLEIARQAWRESELSTQELAAGLSEQLRLILEPKLATKLRGDYKTGKRLNMKRIIPYIASDFRKDKIWLRRTKPSKRQYQIMIAVDDSKSMSESKATQLAFHSIALVSKALTQLESGELSVVRFGEDVKLVHPFDKPFGTEAGAQAFQWFDFKQERTDIKQLCTESLKIFANARSSTNTDLWQLQIILSDGVCEDHATIQRLVRQARDEKVMLVFVVMDGILSKESILDMSQVSYVPDPVTGAMKLKVENYLDTFPFEFYVVVRDITELPEMLSLILRQYFSEVSNL